MSHRYLDTLTTTSVKAAQQRYGSRTSMERATRNWDTDGFLGPDEITYLAGRDGFYLATVGETGWPYVQYRGGPAGFLHVLPDRDGHGVLAWADLRGNRQYLSVGNLAGSPRVSILLMDYANRQRLKILGTATVHDLGTGDSAPAAELVHLARRLTPPPDAGRPPVVERIVTVDVHGYDWNCPQHITPRWTREELAPALTELHGELARLRSENERLRATVGDDRSRQRQDQP
jgi:uncharacterized protein